MASNVSAGKKLARIEKVYLHSDWTSDSNIWMVGGQGGDLSARKSISIFNILDKVKNC